MPIYEYACSECRSGFELLMRSGDEPECPSCGSRQLEKQFSVPAAHTANSNPLPICQPPAAGGCGLPQCGMGGCMLE